jgi:hypothetical protein
LQRGHRKTKEIFTFPVIGLPNSVPFALRRPVWLRFTLQQNMHLQIFVALDVRGECNAGAFMRELFPQSRAREQTQAAPRYSAGSV